MTIVESILELQHCNNCNATDTVDEDKLGGVNDSFTVVRDEDMTP